MERPSRADALSNALPPPRIRDDPRDSSQVERGTGRKLRVRSFGELDDAVSVDELPDAVFVIDEAGLIALANRATAELVGAPVEHIVGTSAFDFVHPDDANLVLNSLSTVTSKPVGNLISIRVKTTANAWIPLEVRGAVRTINDETMIVLIGRSVHDRHELDLDGGETQVLRSVMANMHGMVALVDPDGKTRSINGAVTRVLGLDPSNVRGRPFIEFVDPEDQDAVYNAVTALGPGESVHLVARFLTAAGDDHINCEFTANNMVDDPTVQAYVVSGQVAAALNDARQRVDFLADHDSRTGLLNRDGFMRNTKESIESGTGLGLMIIDIVQFRAINELYGEDVGDSVLTAVASRIDDIRWPDMLAARFGGDEFVVAVRSVTDAAIEMLRERVRREVARPVLIDNQEINIAVRTAAAFEPRPQGLESLLTSASNDLMRTKRNADPESGGISVDAINERRRHLDQLRNALATGEIQPFFQPIVDPTGQIIAVEALVRWVHPVRGVLGVGEILPLAQMAGLGEAIDDTVLNMSLAFAHRLSNFGRPDVEVHVNVDPKILSNPDFSHNFLQRCLQHGADPNQIVIEITETDLLAPGVASLNNLHELRRAGIHVSIDDFGTGYSSLSHLLELPVDGVKIDRRFVAGIDVDSAATNLTTAILGLSESLQLGCVAEGVEQPYQRDRLAALGCNAFQGWLFAPAVSADDVLEMLPALDATPVDLSQVDYV